MDCLLKKCRITNSLLRECLAECLGVYIMIAAARFGAETYDYPSEWLEIILTDHLSFYIAPQTEELIIFHKRVLLFGCGSVAQVTTTENNNGHYLSINLGFALGTTFGVFVSRGVSGAHLNPAVSLSLCFLGRHPWTRLPFYVFAQILGAFLAAATVGLQYYDAIQHYSGGHLTVSGPTATAGIFSTYPADYLNLWGGIVDQVVGTAALMVCILALGDSRNSPAPAGMEPVLVGAVVLVIGVSMGSNSGYALNPARDFGPRLFTYIAGWGDEVFRAGGSWWWVPLVGPCVGALVGTLIYKLLIEVHHPDMGLISESSNQGHNNTSEQEVELGTVHLEKKEYSNDGHDGILM